MLRNLSLLNALTLSTVRFPHILEDRKTKNRPKFDKKVSDV